MLARFRYYSATIIKMTGIKSEAKAIWLAVIPAGVNFVFTFVGVFLVERLGRRKLTLGSLIGALFLDLLILDRLNFGIFKMPVVTVLSSNISYLQGQTKV